MAKAKKVEIKKTKKKIKQNHPKALATVKSSYNNTIISITDLDGNVLVSSSPGTIGYSGSKKSTAYAATRAAEDAAEKAKKYGVKELTVRIKGMGMGRQAAVKGLTSAGLKVRMLMDITPIPHGGCTPRKQRRA